MTPAVRLDASVRIPVLDPLRAVNEALLELLQSFTPQDWRRPTVHLDRDVKDLTAHLLQSSLSRVSAIRDGYRKPPDRPIDGIVALTAMIQQNNREFMTGMRQLSSRILLEMIAVYDREMVAAFETLDPEGEGLGVAWAGEEVSFNWFDVAREYTEKWHHQQQLRDATGRPPLYQAELLAPVLETFARGLPFAFRSVDAADGMRVAVNVNGPVTLGWTLRREAGAWSLWSGADPQATASVTLPADLAWRVWTKGVKPEAALEQMETRGGAAWSHPLARFVAIMA